MKKTLSFLLALALLLSLSPAAFAEDAEALYERGMELFLAEDFDGAYKTLTEAAGQGHPGAQFGLAICHLAGVGGAKKDQKTATALIAVSALNGFNKEKIIEWLNKYAGEGSAIIQYIAGELYREGGFVDQDGEKAFQYVKMAADQGFRDAVVRLGEMYLSGTGVKKDPDKAKALFEELLEKDPYDRDTRYSIALVWLQHDEDVDYMTEQKAIRMLKELSADQHTEASYLLAVYSYENLEYEEAFQWGMKAAKQGSANAMYLVGKLYDYGLGVKQNKEEAKRWLDKAQEAGQTVE